jgi:hypothetical protein
MTRHGLYVASRVLGSALARRHGLTARSVAAPVGGPAAPRRSRVSRGRPRALGVGDLRVCGVNTRKVPALRPINVLQTA